MTEPRTCPNCATAVPPEAPGGACPRCLMALAFATDPGAAPPPDVPAAEVARRFPAYEVGEPLGRGGMGVVFRARQKALDREVALKVLPGGPSRGAAFAERFEREARALARLQHPGIVQVFDFGTSEDGWCYLAMELVEGTNLRRVLAERRLAPREALAIVPQICDALQYAHDKGVVHRDVKPENVLLAKDGRVKIADFGLAKLVEGARGTALTWTGVAMGTPVYMAPEQLERPGDVDHRADIYSLGVVFYEMLTGELPIGRFAAPSAKSAVDARIDEIVLRTLEKERDARFQHVAEVRTRIDAAASAPPPVPPAPARRRMHEWFAPPAPDARLSKLAVAAAVSTLVVLTVLAANAHHPAQILYFGGFALFAHCVLAVVAWGRIRQSAGRLWGVPLAVLALAAAAPLGVGGLVAHFRADRAHASAIGAHERSAPWADPRLAPLETEIARAQERLDDLLTAKQLGDDQPEVVVARKRLRTLEERRDQLEAQQPEAVAARSRERFARDAATTAEARLLFERLAAVHPFATPDLAREFYASEDAARLYATESALDLGRADAGLLGLPLAGVQLLGAPLSAYRFLSATLDGEESAVLVVERNAGFERWVARLARDGRGGPWRFTATPVRAGPPSAPPAAVGGTSPETPR